MANEFARNVADSNFVVSRLLPAANTTVTSSDLDLGAIASGSSFPENCEFQVKIPATAAHTAGILTCTVQGGSATAGTTQLFPSFTVASGTAGGSETIQRFKLPSNCSRYVNLKIVNSTSTDGDSTGITATLSLLF
jgi:hypothetical protein